MENITPIAEMLSERIRAELRAGFTLSDIEQTTRRVLLECGRQAIELMVNSEEARYAESEIACPQCTGAMPYIRRRSAQLHTMFGQLGVRRAYYLCGSCHKGCFPVDRRLGLRPNAMSAELERLAAMTGTLLPFGKGGKLFQELTLVKLSDHSLDKAAQAYGRAATEREQAWQQVAYDQSALQQRKREARRPARIYGAIDATKVHTRGGDEHPWRDLKVGAWFEARGKPPKTRNDQWQIQAENIVYYADICPASEFGNLFWATGVQRHAQLAREVVILGDGAEWIWNLVEQHFPLARQILDWFHATEYLSPVAKAAFVTEVERESWTEQMKQALWDGRLDEVITTCQQLIRRQDSSDPAFVAARYYEKNRSRMDYPTYRRQGYQIGSGTIESAAKQIGTMRMKVAGAIWNEDSARLVAKARAAFLSDDWDSLAAYRSLPLVS